MPDHRSRAPGVLMLLGSISSIQIGSAVATFLFGSIGPVGAVFLRVVISAVLLMALWRPSLNVSRQQLIAIIAFGIALTGSTLAFYGAIERIPLGTASTIEFMGPLAVAVITSRRRTDLVWVAMALIGVILLAGGIDTGTLDPAGVALALLAGFFWASYILVGTRLGGDTSGGGPLALAMVVSTILILPFGVVIGGSELLSPSVLALGLAVSLLTAAIPYSLEFEAMRRLPSSAFGVMMSLEPAVATLAGFLVLGQAASPLKLFAIGLVVCASIGILGRGETRPIEP